MSGKTMTAPTPPCGALVWHSSGRSSTPPVAVAPQPGQLKGRPMAETGTARGAHTVIHYHRNGKAAVDAATARARNTTIVIGADLDKGALLLDVDVQGEVCA